MRLELFLALRLLRDARTQSALIASGAAVGVAVLIFLSALITGLQEDLLSRTVGSQAHLTLEPAPRRETHLFAQALGDSVHVLVKRQTDSHKPITLSSPDKALHFVRTFRSVVAATPLCEGPATALRGTAVENVALTGIEPDTFTDVIDLEARLVDGSFTVGDSGAVLGQALAQALGASVNDRIRLSSNGTSPEPYTVRGIVRVGVKRTDETLVLLSLRDAQSVLGLRGGMTGVAATVQDIFQAESLSQTLGARTGLKATSWMARNAELLTGLRSQSSSSTVIEVFVMLSVAIGIASVLAVSVVQRRREIGILRAMGLPRRLTQRIFLIQGGLLGLGGALLGSGLGSGLILVFEQITVRADGHRLFPIALSPALLLGAGAVAVVTGLLAAAFPARRAARLDPMVAIRNE